MKNATYLAPEIEIVCVQTRDGFADSCVSSPNGLKELNAVEADWN